MIQKIVPGDKFDNKVVKQYADASLGKKCYYFLMKEYFSKLPKDAPNDVLLSSLFRSA